MNVGGQKNRNVIYPDSYILNYVKIENSLGEEWDITSHVVDIQIFESIMNFSLRYEISIVDASDLLNFVRFTGDEIIRFDISKMTINGKINIEKECYVSSIPVYGRKSENLQILKIECISKHAYLASIQRISRKFSGSPTKLIKDLIEGDLQTEVTHFDENSAGHITGVYPYMTISEAIGWLQKRAFDEEGLPFFIFETVSDGIHIDSYNSMRQHVQEGTYIQASLSDHPTVVSNMEGEINNPNSQYGKAFRSQKYRILSIDSKLGLSKIRNCSAGAYASRTLEVDVATKNFAEYDFKYDGKNIVDKIPIYNENFRINDKQLNEYTDVVRNTIHKNSLLYQGTYSYNDRISPVAGRMGSLLETLNSISHIMSVPGDVECHAGSTVNIKLPRAVDKALTGLSTDQLSTDPYMSGDYLLVSTHHIFDGDGHTMSMKIKRDSVGTDLKENRR